MSCACGVNWAATGLACILNRQANNSLPSTLRRNDVRRSAYTDIGRSDETQKRRRITPLRSASVRIMVQSLKHPAASALIEIDSARERIESTRRATG
jgi:hypothetical protein